MSIRLSSSSNSAGLSLLGFFRPVAHSIPGLGSTGQTSVLHRRFGTGNSTRGYSKTVHEHFTNPRNVGSLDRSDPSVGTAVVGKAACGDVIKLQVKVEDDIIKDVKFKAFGCGSAIASSSYASELITGLSTQAALQIKNSEIAESLALPPVKIHCSLLAEDAIKMAIKDYQAKQQKSQQESGGVVAAGVA